MSVHVIDTIKPKNGLNFPVVEAEDVACGSARLSDIVATMATQSDIEALQTAINGKASQSDLEALQATVADKADAADLTALEAEVDEKADSSALTTAAANLQAQINQLITPVTQDAEVENARISSDGTSYTTLKERLDIENQWLRDALTEIGNSASGLNIILEKNNTYPLGYRNGSFQVDDGESSSTHNYVRTFAALPIPTGTTKIIIAPVASHKVRVIWFTDTPDFSNEADNSAIFYSGTEISDETEISVIPNKYCYIVVTCQNSL